jgi:N-acetylglucosaminyldiphosphoundecaprenol N-acetyl-beta-D-mannosaminyltransferase
MDIEISDPQRIEVLKVPIDSIEPDYVPAIIRKVIDSDGNRNIVLLSIWDLLRARSSNEYRSLVQGATLVIPISKSIVTGAKFLTGIAPYRYIPFDFIVKLLIAIEERELSLYLLGGRRKTLKKVEKNIRQTFPNVQIVGRYTGHYWKRDEASIVQAIKRASPTLLLVGNGVRGGERWIARHSDKLGPGVHVWCSDLYDIFAKRKLRPPYILFDHGLEWLWFLPQKFMYILRIFPFIYYNILLLIYKIFKKKSPSVEKMEKMEKVEKKEKTDSFPVDTTPAEPDTSAPPIEKIEKIEKSDTEGA